MLCCMAAIFHAPLLILFGAGLLYGWDAEVSMTETHTTTAVSTALPWFIAWAILGSIVIWALLHRPPRRTLAAPTTD